MAETEIMRVTVLDPDNMLDKVSGSSAITVKFIIIRSWDEFVLIFGLLDRFPYHANLIEWFCNDRQIASSWNHKPDRFEIYDPMIKICGGGYLEINDARKTSTFSGASTAYGSFTKRDLEFILQNADYFNEYTTQIS